MRTETIRKQVNIEETVPFTVRLSVDDMKLLGALSKRTGKTKESLVKKFVADGAEDMGDVIIAKDAIEEVESGRGRIYSHEEAWAEIELDN